MSVEKTSSKDKKIKSLKRTIDDDDEEEDE